MNLYELNAEYRQIEALMEEAEEDGAQASPALLSQCMEAVEADIEAKFDAITRLISNEESREEALAAEIKFLQAKKKSAGNKQKWLKEYLRDFMKASGKEKVKTILRTISLRKPSVSLEVDESKVLDWPAEMFDAAVKVGAIVERYEINKTKLKQLPNHLELPGVREVEGEYSITIR